jgi:hypothetical protein
VNEERILLIHGQYVLPIKPEPGAYFHKVDRDGVTSRNKVVDPSGLEREASVVKSLTDCLMHTLELEFPDFNAYYYMRGIAPPSPVDA